MGADVAGAADRRPLHERAPAEVGLGVDHGMRDRRLLAQGHAGRQHRVRPDRRCRVEPAVVAYEGRPGDTLDVVKLDTLTEPDVSAELDPRDVEPDLLVERVEVRLAVLVEVADVLPVAVHHVAVQGPAHLEQ